MLYCGYSEQQGAEMDYDELERDWDEPYEPEYEDDGQPDEAQEWHDFDPDC